MGKGGGGGGGANEFETAKMSRLISETFLALKKDVEIPYGVERDPKTVNNVQAVEAGRPKNEAGSSARASDERRRRRRRSRCRIGLQKIAPPPIGE